MTYRKVRSPHGHITVEPLPSESELADFYSRIYYQERPTATYQAQYSELELTYKRLIADQIVYALTLGHQASGGAGHRFLEVGYGEGFGLAAASRAGWDIAGIDLSDYSLQTFHPSLLAFVTVGHVSDGLAQLMQDGQTFDAIVLQNVMEHVRDPWQMLADVHSVLDDGGLVSITLPNDESDIQSELICSGDIGRDYWFAPPQHLHYFNIQTAKKFVEDAGFEVRDLYSDFPIEYYLFHPGSNYVQHAEAGRAAHQARIRITALLQRNGMGAYHELCRAQAKCGVGRAFTLVLGRSGS